MRRRDFFRGLGFAALGAVLPQAPRTDRELSGERTAEEFYPIGHIWTAPRDRIITDWRIDGNSVAVVYGDLLP